MELQLEIPFSFIRARVDLTWTEVLFGLENLLIAPDLAIEIATERLEPHRASSSVLLDLAIANRSEPTRHHVEALARQDPDQSIDDVTQVWLYLTLAWLFENRSSRGSSCGR